MNPARLVLRGAILGYRYLISPLRPGSCRFEPTCSAYALDAVDRFGAVAGGRLAVRRLLRCHPWGGWGYDPVPDSAETGAGAVSTEGRRG